MGRWLIGPWLDRIGRAMNRLAFRELAVRPGEQVLEIGFGGGELAARLLAAGAELTGVDLSEAMVARALRRFRREAEEGRARFLVGSAASLPLADGAVDVACSVNTLYFWNDPAAVLAELHRVVRPGGRLLLCFQTPEAVRAWPGHRYGFVAHEPADVVRMIGAAGFRVERTASGSEAPVGEFVCITAERR